MKPLHNIAKLLALSIALEASATPKPGNVHRLRDLPELRYEDFLATSIIAYRYLYIGARRGYSRRRYRVLLGDLIYKTLRETMGLTRRGNTCLGSMLLLTPLSISLGMIVGDGYSYSEIELIPRYTGIVIGEATVYDTIWFYRAVRLAKPSYIKPTDETDGLVNVWDPRFKAEIVRRGQRFYDTIKYSSGRDIVATELYEAYPRSFKALRFLEDRLEEHRDWNRGVVETYLYLLSRNPDTTITRTHGSPIAYMVMDKAKHTLQEITSMDEWVKPVVELDEEFRSMGLNLGSIADLVVSTIALYLLKHGGIP